VDENGLTEVNALKAGLANMEQRYKRIDKESTGKLQEKEDHVKESLILS
jgi:hypothetical protein